MYTLSPVCNNLPGGLKGIVLDLSFGDDPERSPPLDFESVLRYKDAIHKYFLMPQMAKIQLTDRILDVPALDLNPLSS